MATRKHPAPKRPKASTLAGKRSQAGNPPRGDPPQGDEPSEAKTPPRVIVTPQGRQRELPPYETIALVLQGGGALGAYQAGVFQGLSEAGIEPDCLSGISIGALNTAIIAGNPPERRVARLVEFWETICQSNTGLALNPFVEASLFGLNDTVRQTMSAFGATSALVSGQKGFFRPRVPPPAMFTPGSTATASYYDTRALQDTLERLCDFDRINSGRQRISVGAVNVRTGNFVYFDNARTKLDARHFMASGALPPAFPAIEIDGDYYWDGGLVSNTPLSYVLESRPLRDTLAFQVDLWSARGQAPTNMGEVSDRIKEIRYSSRTRLVTEEMRKAQYLRHMLARVLEKIPPARRAKDPYCQIAGELACSKRYNVIHLIYRDKPYEQHYKDYQFSLSTMRDHWAGGLADIRETLKNPAYLDMPDSQSGFVTHDVHRTEIES